MPEGISGKPTICFGPFELDRKTAELRKHDRKIRLQEQPFQILLLLLEKPGEVVLREEIREKLWPNGTIVEFDHSINAAVKRLRDALGESAEEPLYVETLARRGYRFIGKVATESVQQPEPAAELMAEAQPKPGRKTRNWRPIAILGLIVVAATVLTKLGLVFTNSVPAQGAPQIRSIAVLPLRNVSRDSDQDYIADGITTALTTDLAQISAINVIAPSSVRRYRGTAKTAPEIGRELYVDALVEGSVQRVGDRLLITAQLTEVSSARLIWAKSYQADLRDLIALQNDLAQTITSEIKLKLTPEEQSHLASARRVNPAAQEAYLRGLHSFQLGDFQKALSYFQQANRSDPDFAEPYAASGAMYGLSMLAGVLQAEEGYPKWKAAVTKALELDDTLAEAHESLADLLQFFDWNWPEAEKQYLRALQLNTNLATAHLWYASLLQTTGRNGDAVMHAKLAAQLDPYALHPNMFFAEVLWRAGRNDEAIEQAKKVIAEKLDPTQSLPLLTIGRALEQKGKLDEAISELERAIENGRATGLPLYPVRADLAHAYLAFGKKKEAMQILDELKQASTQRKIPSWPFAVIYTALGDKDSAFRYLDKSFDERPGNLPLLRHDPRMEPLRTDPRYFALLRRMNLQP